jgi:hypothetical protein
VGSKSCFGSDPRVRHMTVDSRVSRVCSVLSLLLLRLVAIVIASALILEVLRLLLETLVSQKFDRNTEYLVWTSVAIGALAVQKLQELFECADLDERLIHVRVVRFAPTGLWLTLGRVLQRVQIQNVLMVYDIDEHGPTPWNTSWTITIFHDGSSRTIADWTHAVARSTSSLVSLLTSPAVRVTYTVPIDRYTGQPDQQHATLSIAAFRRTVLDGFMKWVGVVDAHGDLLLTTEDASAASIDFHAISQLVEPLPYAPPEDSWSPGSMHVSIAGHDSVE